MTVSVKKLDTLAQDLEQALRRLLTEPSFSANAARISHTMRAHRLTPVEKAAGHKSPRGSTEGRHARHSKGT